MKTMKTFALGRVFITTTLQAQGAPLIDKGITHETPFPGRRGECFVIRPPFTRHRPVRALCVGLWASSP